MMVHRRRRAALAGAVLGVCLTAAACSSGGSGASTASGSPVSGSTGSGSTAGGKLSLTAEDYYTAEPTHSVVGGILNACAAAAGVTITQDSVANPQLMPKVLQQLSAHTL